MVHRKHNYILKADNSSRVRLYSVKRTFQIREFNQLKQERDGSNLGS